MQFCELELELERELGLASAAQEPSPDGLRVATESDIRRNSAGTQLQPSATQQELRWNSAAT